MVVEFELKVEEATIDRGFIVVKSDASDCFAWSNEGRLVSVRCQFRIGGSRENHHLLRFMGRYSSDSFEAACTI